MKATTNADLVDIQPKIGAVLDPGFTPAALVMREYRRAAAASKSKIPLVIAVERNGGMVTHFTMDVLAPGSPHDAVTALIIERTVKFLLWARGGFRVYIGGPAALGEPVRKAYTTDGARRFDAELMGRVYEKPFEVIVTDPARIPAHRESLFAIGGHRDGHRIGFDLGASDYKIAAVSNGECVFTTELPWNPSVEPDPAYHYAKLTEGLKLASKRLPQVDAIGGSSAGIIIDNQIMVASLFRAVPPALFARSAKSIFLRLRDEWKVPVEVANDGDVTALAGAMSLNRNAMLGIAMGSSEAAGYLDPNGRLLGWLSELAFAPVDFNPGATADEWSGDTGVGALYFSQQAVNKLAPAAGFNFPADMKLPERLKAVQAKADAGDANALKVFETIGVYLGYAMPYYAMFYDAANMLILGRVTSGRGGELIIDTARKVLRREFPEVAERITLHVPDEKSRRVGQAVAAASLPQLARIISHGV